MVVSMHRLARFLDPRNTIEGKIVSVILSIVLVFSMVNLSAVVENASAAGSDGDALFTTELATDDKAANQMGGVRFPRTRSLLMSRLMKIQQILISSVRMMME